MTNAIVTTAQSAGNAGNYDMVSRDTTDEMLVYQWLHTGKRATSPRTQALYMRIWRAFSASVGAPLQALTLTDLQTWRESLTGAPATQRVHIAAIRSLFAHGQKVGYLRFNPSVMLATPPVGETKHRRVVSRDNMVRILDACHTAQESALLRVLYSSGARVSEVLALQWQDVTPRVNSEGGNAGAVLHIVCGKGSKSREAGIDAVAYGALDVLRDGAPDTAYCFATRTGKALDRQRAHRVIKDVMRRAGLKDGAGKTTERKEKDAAGLPSAHWFRHSHATHALAAGANVVDVQTQLGHSSLATTTGYAHAAGYSCDKLTF